MFFNGLGLKEKEIFNYNRKYYLFYIRLTINIVITYMILFKPGQLAYPYLAYSFVAIFLLSNIVLYYVPQIYFHKKEILYILGSFDTIAIALGIILSGYGDTQFFMLYFLIISLAAMSMNLKYLIANTLLLLIVYYWFLYATSQLFGEFFTGNLLKVSFILSVAMFLGYIVQCFAIDLNRSTKIRDSALNDTLNSVVLTNFNGELIYANTSFLDLINIDNRSKIIGKNINEIFPAQKNLDSFFESLKNFKSWHGELFFSLNNGKLLVFSTCTSIIKDDLDKTFCYIISFVNITRRKKAEMRLKKINRNLNKLLSQKTKELEQQSLRDNLTGLFNRNFFENEMMRLATERYTPMGIIICDLDGLKFINDTLGHQSGDQMLITVADILRQNFRSSDILARIGGDEFAVLLPETAKEVVEQIFQRLRQAVQDYNNSDPNLPLSLSIGYAVDEEGTIDMQALFREADNLMYREKLQRDGSARNAIVQALTVSMRARDFDTEGHCERLQELAASLALSLDLSQNFVNDLFLFMRFHDLGKVGIPDNILFKHDRLTEEEWRQMRQHCEIGHRIASSVPDLQHIADYILKHHEWWDGRGYPLGLSGHDIPLACRILAVVDAYDAMTSKRPYARAMSHQDAISELKRCAGTQFDPKMVELFVEIAEATDGDCCSTPDTAQ